MKRCTGCGAEISGLSKYCENCGAPTSEAVDIDRTYESTATQQREAEPVAKPVASYNSSQFDPVDASDKAATSSLVCGIIGLLFCGLLFGIIAIGNAMKAKKAGNTSGKATAGLVLGIIDISIYVVAVAIGFLAGLS